MDTEAGILIPLLGIVPWVAFAVVTLLRLKEPPALGLRIPEGTPPHVTVIVPARNEARNIENCVSTILGSDYPHFDLVVLDDRSTDDTAQRATQTAHTIPGGAERLSVVMGAPLPDGWFGKPWACHQAVQHARGDVFLFTDADTTHDATLLGRSVASMEDSSADALTLIARQLMYTFWERVVQPHVFFMIGWRFGDLARLYDPVLVGANRWRKAIANGQFIMIRRDAYEAIGGHEAVKNEVVEDLRLAQEIVRSGRGLAMRDAQDVFSTRMYRSFSDLAEGWTKNLWTGATQAFGRAGAGTLTAAAVLGILTFWVIPPLVLGISVFASALGYPMTSPTAWTLWSGATVGISAIFWTAVTARFRAPAVYGLFYPLGAAVLAALLVRSGMRGTRIEWKGRQYTASVRHDLPNGP